MSTAVQDAASTPAAAPEVLGGLVAYLQVDGAVAAAEFYKRAFDATEVARHPVDDKGRTMHIHLHVNGSSLMLSDAYPEHGYPLEQPKAFSLTLIVKDIDSWWSRAVAAGAEVTTPVDKMFWGDRYGEVRDPFGVRWAMNEPAAWKK